MGNFIHNQIYARNASVSVRTADNGAMLFHADTSQAKAINASGLMLWDLADGSRSIDGLLTAFGDGFDSPLSEQARNDSLAFIHELHREGYLDALDALISPIPVQDYSGLNDAPVDCDISLTGRCNLRCAYCFYANEMQVRLDLSTEDWIMFFGELGRLGVKTLTLSGGEVFIRPDLWTLIDSVIANRMRFSILSNGTLIDESAITALLHPPRRKRFNCVQVSVDGSRADVHDASRGAGSFVKAVRAIRLLREAGLPCACRVTLNRHNVEDLDDVARLLLEDLGLPSFSTNEAVPMGSGCVNQGETGLMPFEQLQVMKSLERLTLRYPGRITATAGPLSKLKQYREMEQARLTGRLPLTWRMGSLTACGGVFNKLAIHHDGTMAACNMLSGVELGHINHDSLSHVWLHHPQLKALRERQHLRMGDLPECQDCEWADFCNGSCPSMAFERTGGFNVANMEDCYRRFLGGISEMDRVAMFINSDVRDETQPDNNHGAE